MEHINLCKHMQKETQESLKDLNLYLTSLTNKVI